MPFCVCTVITICFYKLSVKSQYVFLDNGGFICYHSIKISINIVFGGVKMNIWHNVSPDRIKPHDYLGVIEISEGSKMKYELDKETGALILDRVLYTSTIYPANYGFIPRTFADDSDPLDILVLCTERIQPMTLVRCYPIGVISMDDNGKLDEKIIAIPYGDPTYNVYRDISGLPQHISEEMEHFFSVYKQLEFKATAVSKTANRVAAERVVKRAIEQYAERREELMRNAIG